MIIDLKQAQDGISCINGVDAVRLYLDQWAAYIQQLHRFLLTQSVELLIYV